MNNFRDEYRNRRYLANVSAFGTIQLHERNPLIVALWSVSFPGFGHFLLHKYIRGFALFTWELFINQLTMLNTAMMHSFQGNFALAKAALNEKYVYLYIPVYLFAIWDSYTSAVEENNLYLLAKREDAPYSSFVMNALGLNYLTKKKPWLAIAWSSSVPSLGQLYTNRIASSLFTLFFTIIIAIQSNMIEGLHHFLLGHWAKSREVMNPQWVLYFPSVYFFSMYDAYVNTVENNKLFDHELAGFLQSKHQPQAFILHKGEKVH